MDAAAAAAGVVVGNGAALHLKGSVRVYAAAPLGLIAADRAALQNAG